MSKAVSRLLSPISQSPSLPIRLTLGPSLMITICRLVIAPWPELSSPELSAIASCVQPRTCPFHICNVIIAGHVSHFSSSALLHLETRHQASVRCIKLRFLLPFQRLASRIAKLILRCLKPIEYMSPCWLHCHFIAFAELCQLQGLRQHSRP